MSTQTTQLLAAAPHSVFTVGKGFFCKYYLASPFDLGGKAGFDSTERHN
jgi:hypothetical protein